MLGITGIEATEMLDTLAARDSARIGSTIQLSDAGIQPGAGVGNHRRPLTKDSLGVDVVAVGMPTVIYAATLARDAFAVLAARDGSTPSEDALDGMERELFGQEIGEMIVTPREIDAIVEDASAVIASGINRALHPSLSDAEISAMMN